MFNSIPNKNYSGYVQFLGKVKIISLSTIGLLLISEVIQQLLFPTPLISLLFTGTLVVSFGVFYSRLLGPYQRRRKLVIPLNILFLLTFTLFGWHCYQTDFHTLPFLGMIFVIMTAVVTLDSFRNVLFFMMLSIPIATGVVYLSTYYHSDSFLTYTFGFLVLYTLSFLYQFILNLNTANLELNESIVKATDRIILVFDEEGQAFYCNPFTYEILGFEEGEVLGDNWWITRGFSDKIIAEKKENIRRMINLESPLQNITTKVQNNHTGESLWIEWRDVLLEDKKIMAIGKDVTKARNREKELELLTLVGDKITNGVMVTNKFGDIEWVNDGFSDIFGYHKNEILGRKPIEIFKERDNDDLLKFKLNDANYVVGQNYESLQYTKSGERIWVLSNSTPIYDQEGEINRSIEIFTDISEAKELREEHEHIVANVSDIIYKIKLNGGFTYVNKSVQYLTGFSDDEILKMKFTDLVHPKDYVKVTEYYDSQIKDEIEESYSEFRILTKDGDTKWVGQTVKASRNETNYNKLDGFTAVVRDISEKKRFELQLLQKNKDITDSINYAQRIQSALLNNQERDNEILPPHFLFYQPKDIISGDFYWYEKVDNHLIIAIGDCTGHGVPGALMTSLGVTALNQIVTEKKVISPAEIMRQLDDFVNYTFSSSTENGMTIRDGMDVGIIAINLSSKLSKYCGSRRPLLLRKDDTFELIPGTKRSIGDERTKNTLAFAEQEVELNENATIYLFSDGVTDQFGGPRDKKLTLKRLVENLQKVANEDIELQGKHIEEYIREWTDKGETGQTDDIVLFGIKPF